MKKEGPKIADACLINVGIGILMRAAAEHSAAAGFRAEPDTRNEAELIALIHAELSEALEYLRRGHAASDHIPNFLGVEEELADAVIRIADYAAGRDYRLGAAIVEKLKYNSTRPRKHGKNF